jgi:hypothetical protein
MAYVGINVHKKQRQMCLLTEAGSLPALMHPRGPHCARGVDRERVGAKEIYTAFSLVVDRGCRMG